MLTTCFIPVSIISFIYTTGAGAKNVGFGSTINLYQKLSRCYIFRSGVALTDSGSEMVLSCAKEIDDETAWSIVPRKSEGALGSGNPIPCNSIISLSSPAGNSIIFGKDSPSVIAKEATAATGKGEMVDYKVICTTKSAKYWKYDEPIKLYNLGLNKYLSTASSKRFTQSNCPRCSIVGHSEVYHSDDLKSNSEWIASTILHMDVEREELWDDDL